jgi:hypothetical protein
MLSFRVSSRFDTFVLHCQYDMEYFQITQLQKIMVTCGLSRFLPALELTTTLSELLWTWY